MASRDVVVTMFSPGFIEAIRDRLVVDRWGDHWWPRGDGLMCRVEAPNLELAPERFRSRYARRPGDNPREMPL